MSPSTSAGLAAPQRIAGGFVLIPVAELTAAWRACRARPLGVGDFRAWLACRELTARRSAAKVAGPASYGCDELARLTGVAAKRARASVRRLADAGLLAWSDEALEFSVPAEATGDLLADTIGGGKGRLVVPRRVLRFLARGARPALIATTLAALLRCLARGRGGFRPRGRLKSSWVARAFGVDPRRVKQARKELVELGWLTPEPDGQHAMNRWGRAYRIDLAWVPPVQAGGGPRLPPPPASGGPRLPPPDLHPEPLRGQEHQEPAQGGPTGVQTRDEKTPAAASPTPASAPTPPPVERSSGEQSASATAGEKPSESAAGTEGRGRPAPTLCDVRVDDLKETARLLRLHGQAVDRGLVGASEADRLRFVAAAEHALAVGTSNPPGLFAHLVRGRLWRFLTQVDEDRANARLKHERRVGGPAPPAGLNAIGRGGDERDSGLSTDAEVVRAVRAAVIRAGVFRDPYPEFARLNPAWTRARWDAALAEPASGWRVR